MVKNHNHINNKEHSKHDEKKTSHSSSKGILGKLVDFYFNSYKKLLIIPFVILFIAFFLIGMQYYTTGDFINKGISLKGGTSFTISSSSAQVETVSISNLEQSLKNNFPNVDIEIRDLKELTQRKAISIDVDIENAEELDLFKTFLVSQFDGLSLEELNGDMQTTGASLGNAFFKQILFALLLAFLFMGIVVFIQFRVAIPSLTVMLCAFSIIIETLAVVNLLDIKISTAGISAFLMLIGYSVDTDILLSSRLLKSKFGTVREKMISAFKTGILMTVTTIAALVVGLTFSTSPVISQIMLILLIGLVFDIFNTWLQSAGLLRLYIERKERGERK
jgi:preprotein translocase subunit SecF